MSVQGEEPDYLLFKRAAEKFLRGFILAYGIRTGVSLLLHALNLLRRKRARELFSIAALVGESNLVGTPDH